ncbi:hypothetical protein SAMN04488121_101505 [Chitinophaga filiformis]|uniref:Uncharacterized protein n=1 Tax=Chitinophaga filiformis TaxID=104663 RepID=A0A1G7HLI2_CHIFI|nr:hypothetical protein SAMN04488121_101505 [Chitinophaga filiformis]
MRKARSILLAIVFFALIGGLFASKMSRIIAVFYSNGTTLTTTTPGGPLVVRTYCTVVFFTVYTTIVIPGAFSTTTRLSTTSIPTTICPLITIYVTI